MADFSEIFAGVTEDMYKCVLSNPAPKDCAYRKITVTRLSVAGETAYQAEKLTETQAFHENLSFPDVRAFLAAEFGARFRQCAMWDGEFEYSYKLTGKNRLLKNKRPVRTPPAAENRPGHDRIKKYILGDAASAAPPLVDMGIFTSDGKIVKSMYAKYRQVNRFLEIVDDEVSGFPGKSIRAVDFGCGKSWLTFVLYHYLTEIRGLDASVTGLDLKAGVVAGCRAAAEKYGYGGLKFVCGDIKNFQPDAPVDMVVCLHACDTATDYALFNAVKWGAGMIFCVPCCQHEMNAALRSREFALLTRHGLIKERFAALATDAVRANVLEYLGYRTQTLEFTEIDSTPKNLMIRAVRTGKRDENALADAERFMREFGARQKLYDLVKESL